MVSDNELLDEVRAVMHAEVADVTASPAVLAAVHRKRRRRTTFRWLVPIPVVAAAVAVVVALQPVSVPEEPANAAHIRNRATNALSGVTEAVIYERATVTEGDKYGRPGEPALYERWLAADGSTFRLKVTIDDAPVVDLSRDKVSDVFVDYRTRTFRVFPGTEPSAPQYDDVWTPEEIQQALKNGDLQVRGPSDPINNRPTILLHRDQKTAEVPLELWIDAVTYLPVRWQWQQPHSTPFDVTYLPPTPENQAQLTTVIPPGFTEEK